MFKKSGLKYMTSNELAPYLVTDYLRENVKAEYRETPEKFWPVRV